jgi:hypothetical protein
VRVDHGGDDELWSCLAAVDILVGMRAAGSFDAEGRERGARAWLAVLAIAWTAGCFSDRGLAIEIDVGDTGATAVELYIGKTRCEDDAPIDCRGIAPPEAAIALAGDVWFRDQLSPYIASVTGRAATFRLRSDSAATMPIVIAVGVVPGDDGMRAVGSATLRDVDVPVDGARIATATLVPAAPVEPGPTAPGNLTGDRVLVWPTLTSSCLVVEHWKDGVAARDFVVPADDPDCDEVVRECNPAAYHGESPPGASFPDCFTTSGSQGCVLASRGCTDDGGPDSGTCAPHRDPVCVPASFCDNCPELEGPCTRTQIDLEGDLPRVVCNVPARRLVAGLELCPGMASAPLDLSSWVDDAACERAVIGSLQLRDLDTSHDFGGAVIGLSSPSPACSMQVIWKGGTRTVLDARDHGFIKVRFAERALLVPLLLEFTPGCLGAFDCRVEGIASDSLWSCAQ